MYCLRQITIRTSSCASSILLTVDMSKMTHSLSLLPMEYSLSSLMLKLMPFCLLILHLPAPSKGISTFLQLKPSVEWKYSHWPSLQHKAICSLPITWICLSLTLRTYTHPKRWTAQNHGQTLTSISRQPSLKSSRKTNSWWKICFGTISSGTTSHKCPNTSRKSTNPPINFTSSAQPT